MSTHDFDDLTTSGSPRTRLVCLSFALFLARGERRSKVDEKTIISQNLSSQQNRTSEEPSHLGMTPVRAVLKRKEEGGRDQRSVSFETSLFLLREREIASRGDGYSLVVLDEPGHGLVDSLLERSELERLDSLLVDEPEKLLVRCGLSELSVRLGGVELRMREAEGKRESASRTKELGGKEEGRRELTLYSPVNPMDLTTASATVLMETSSSSPTVE